MFKKLIVVAIIFLGVFLRFHNYETYPQRGASSDEYAFAFVGVSLLTQSVPVGWSAFNSYTDKNRSNLTINNLYFPIVKPYFDHPPLYGLLVGGWSVLNGQNTFEKVDLKTIRLVPIFLSFFTLGFLFLLTQKIFDYKTAVFALLIQATTTLFVMNERAVFAETFLTPLFLGTIYFFSRFEKKLTRKKIVILGILCGVAFLAKIVGIALFATILFFLLVNRQKWNSIFLFIAVFFVFVIGFILYGTYYDSNLFWQITLHQSNRAIGPRTILYVLSNPLIVNKAYFDGWYFLGFITLLLTFIDYKKYKKILVPTVFYLLILVATLTQKGEMGWYMIPLFPFMAISIASFIAESLKKQSWYVFLLLLFVGTYAIQYGFEESFGLTPFVFRLFLLIMFVPFFVLFLFRKDKGFSLLTQFWFYVFIIINILLSYSYVHPA